MTGVRLEPSLGGGTTLGSCVGGGWMTPPERLKALLGEGAADRPWSGGELSLGSAGVSPLPIVP
jgi:hypothetical protein